MTRIVGVDPSLVGTGIAVLPHPSTAAPELVPTLVTIGETGSDRDTVPTRCRPDAPSPPDTPATDARC